MHTQYQARGRVNSKPVISYGVFKFKKGPKQNLQRVWNWRIYKRNNETIQQLSWIIGSPFGAKMGTNACTSDAPM